MYKIIDKNIYDIRSDRLIATIEENGEVVFDLVFLNSRRIG